MAIVYKSKNGLLYHGDCFELMEHIALAGDKVDMVLADLPYGTTQNKWDSVLPLDRLWESYYAITHENSPIVLTAQAPFDKALAMSNIKDFRYEWIWHKTYSTGHLNARKMPMKNHENILVFYRRLPKYNPQFTEGEPYYVEVKSTNTSKNYGKQSEYVMDNPGIRYPRSVVTFDKAKGTLHPTQKPLDLFEYMIKTYTDEGDIVLDNVMGSGTTAVACEKLNRRWIGAEKEEEYIKIIIKRLEELDA